MDARPKIRNHMDDILEARGFYRKHLGRDPHSLYRAVAECLFKSQRFYPDVKNDVEQFLLTHNNNNNDGDDDDGDGDVSMHRAAKAVAKIYEVDIEIVSAADSHCVPVIITPESDDEPAGSCGVCDEDDSSSIEASDAAAAAGAGVPESPEPVAVSDFDLSRKREKLLLCYSAPDQYDPIFRLRTIETSGMVQSILFELLYEKVFGQSEVLSAAMFMLSDSPFKPMTYNKNFSGGPWDALNADLMPFAYKVAKAIHPGHYRNIDYDVWRNSDSGSARYRSNRHRPTTLKSIDLFRKDSACTVTLPGGQLVYGFVQGLASDESHVEVFIPAQDLCLYVDPGSVNILRNPPEAFRYLRRSPNDMPQRFPNENITIDVDFTAEVANPDSPESRSEEEIHRTQVRNISLLMTDPAASIDKFDFSVPPPTPTTSHQPDLSEQEASQDPENSSFALGHDYPGPEAAPSPCNALCCLASNTGLHSNPAAEGAPMTPMTPPWTPVNSSVIPFAFPAPATPSIPVLHYPIPSITSWMTPPLTMAWFQSAAPPGTPLPTPMMANHSIFSFDGQLMSLPATPSTRAVVLPTSANLTDGNGGTQTFFVYPQ